MCQSFGEAPAELIEHSWRSMLVHNPNSSKDRRFESPSRYLHPVTLDVLAHFQQYPKSCSVTDSQVLTSRGADAHLMSDLDQASRELPSASQHQIAQVFTGAFAGLKVTELRNGIALSRWSFPSGEIESAEKIRLFYFRT